MNNYNWVNNFTTSSEGKDSDHLRLCYGDESYYGNYTINFRNTVKKYTKLSGSISFDSWLNNEYQGDGIFILYISKDKREYKTLEDLNNDDDNGVIKIYFYTTISNLKSYTIEIENNPFDDGYSFLGITNLIREKLVILDGYVRVTGGLIDANTYEQNTVRVVQGGQCLIL
ncbi:hypothetical protein H8356DRAFT_1280575 [Neocallimastix lanati (nom. inval.)]|uniref:Uncharacterized protein n=1 Tax=Neocallimastix californiae TaxID=1754190 RepID=A0A1Y1ZE75_9FUNG|nr:hypothetical protein H8356DRAFT_1280575 [Neocallimastix sp. JGI-2020a]ORY08558.1 hypothetical protein LY90DRAFT_519003 [Neocallimastix californiae]|eukprot:ORY08558.1 hypothetical protein LY90DRAFT_519003 [Neocallimastix californiae]